MRYTFCVKDKGFLAVSTIKDAYFLQSVIEISVWYICQADVVEIHDKVVLFCVVRNHSIPQNYKHQKIDSIKMLLNGQIQIEFIYAHDNIGPKVFIVSVGVNLSVG